VRDRIQFSVYMIKRFFNWLRTSGVVSIIAIVTWHNRTVNFWADSLFSTGQQTSGKMTVGMCQGRKTALRTLVTFDIVHCPIETPFVWKI